MSIFVSFLLSIGTLAACAYFYNEGYESGLDASRQVLLDAANIQRQLHAELNLPQH